MTREEILYFLAFCEIRAEKKRDLWRAVPDTGVLYRLSLRELREFGLTGREVDAWKKRKRDDADWRREWESLPDRGVRFLTEADPGYPERLKLIYDAPFGLLYKGELPSDRLPAAAVVGARNSTAYGREMARRAGEELARRGVQVVSGMAAGIDGESHRGALAAVKAFPDSAGTFAVFGCGIEVCYPKEHEDLYATIPNRGGLISELGLFTAPLPMHFPMRNRIIAGLSDVVIVVEARKKSGSFLTVDFALEQGRDVRAVPGRLTDPLSEGCHQLIAAGAGIVTDFAEVAEQLYGQAALRFVEKTPRRRETSRAPAGKGTNAQKDASDAASEKRRKEFVDGLATPEKLLYSILDSGPKQRDEIAAQCALSGAQIDAGHLTLEMLGLAARGDGNIYRKV
ncbi:MAG: DNA-processing protein DprA [Lachnospiraceae bacterium]|nr:DNA-processing protein DprA [Lachnospiraceae bacterium]